MVARGQRGKYILDLAKNENPPWNTLPRFIREGNHDEVSHFAGYFSLAYFLTF
jgi:hypothetical protein